MKRFTWILFAFLLSGCPVPDNHPPKPTRTPTVAPTPDSRPAIVQVGNHRELRIGGEKALALGCYHLAVDLSIQEGAIRQAFRGARENGFNLVRVFAYFTWESTYLTPWVKLVDGRSDLGQVSDEWTARLDLVGRLADEEGVCIAWVCWDGYSIRRGADHDPLNPERHLITVPPVFEQIDWDFTGSSAPRARYPFKCSHGEGSTTCGPMEIGSRKSPVWWTLIQNVANIAGRHNDIVYLWSEMFTDEEHAGWDVPAMRWWAVEGVRQVRSIYPSAIIGTSVGVIGPYPDATEALAQAVYDLVDIADLHSLGWRCQPGEIAAHVAILRSACPGVVVCANDDGCMGSPRETAAWCIDAGRAAWWCGGFFEAKSDYPFATEILEAGRTLRGEE